jgi:signal transduction histidine kinase
MLARRPSPETKRETLYDLADELIRSLNTYVAINEDLVQLASTRNEEISRRLAISLLSLGILGSVLGLILGYAIARKVRRSIVQLSLSIRDTAGKLDQVLEPITISSGAGGINLEDALQTVSAKVGTVVERLAISQREHMRAEQLASLGRVSAGLAHELRNPISSMKLLIQSALEKGTTLGDRHLAIMQDEIQRLERLTKTFLDFARPPSLERNRFDLIKVFQQKLLLVSGRLKLKRLTVESEIPEDPLLVEADQGQMRQLLLNLLLNAIDASPEHGKIQVRILRVDSPPDTQAGLDSNSVSNHRRWVLIEIADRGPGLPPVTMDVLFEPFFSTKQEGMGLGLPISKQIIEAHGGTIQAMNRTDGGADFRVFLPIAD